MATPIEGLPGCYVGALADVETSTFLPYPNRFTHYNPGEKPSVIPIHRDARGKEIIIPEIFDARLAAHSYDIFPVTSEPDSCDPSGAINKMQNGEVVVLCFQQ